MTLIDGVGDEVVQIFVAFFFILIATLAWFTTNISNEGTLRTVFLLERRRLRATRRLTNHTESATIVESTLTPEDSENTQETDQVTTEEDKPPEEDTNPENIDEETHIVETMDAQTQNTEASEVRKRRLAFYEKHEKVEEPVDANDKICVKLMYLNDELRHVDGRLDEKLGDFKSRHFEEELSRNKIIKLIFNGHILQPDTETLKSCGLFDNCVVHCLIHQKQRNNGQGSSSTNQSESNHSTSSGGTDSQSFNNNNNNQPHEWHLENFLFGITCCFLGAAWYLRYVYAHLYTVTATIGLILMTGIFTIIMFGIHYPENVESDQQQNSNNNVRAL